MNDEGDEALYEVEAVDKAIRCRDIERSLGRDNLAQYICYDSDSWIFL